MFFFFQAEDGIRDYKVTGVQTCALPILRRKLKGDWETVRPTYQAIKNTGMETAVKVSLSEKMVEENAWSWPRRLSFGENPYCNARFEIRASICWIVDMLLSIAKGLMSRALSKYTFTCAEML